MSAPSTTGSIPVQPGGVTVTVHRGVLLLGFPRRFTVGEAVAFRQCLE